MLYSYAMGVDETIYSLLEHGFKIKKDNNNFMVEFPDNKSEIWETYIKTQLKQDFWNDYISLNNQVVFIFHLKTGFKKYVVNNFKDDEVLALCEEMCSCKFVSLENMIKENKYYKQFLS